MTSLKFLIAYTICLISFTAKADILDSQSDSIRNALDYQMKNYPVSQYRDIYKNFMQDFFGPGHILNDTASSGKYLRHELSSTTKFDGPDFEPTGFKGNFYRVNLRLIKEGIIPYDKFFKIFVESVQGIEPPEPEIWIETWNNIDKEIQGLGLSFPNEEQDRSELLEQFKDKNFVVHHSKAYDETVNFHYRIISKYNFQKYILPLLNNKS